MSYGASRIVDRDTAERKGNMTILAPSMPTIGEIARRLGEAAHRVEYVIRVRQIQPCGWAGHARVFSEEAVQAIGAELQRIDSAKTREQAAATV